MKIITMKCPHCGGQLEIEEGKKQIFCSHCGSKLLIDDEVVHHKLDDAEEAGYRFEKGRQKAQAEARMQQQRQAYSYIPPELEKPKKRRTWLWILGWLCFFPVPLTILMLRKKDMNPKLKYGIIAAGWIAYLAIGMSGGNKSGSTGNNTEASEIKTVSETVKDDSGKSLESLLGTETVSLAESNAAEIKEQESGDEKPDSRPQRNGFDHCNTVTAGLYEFQVPDYFIQTDSVPFYRGYAETGGKTAFLDIDSSFDEEDPVGEEWSDTEEERKEFIDAYFSSILKSENTSNVELLSDGIYKTEVYTGQLFKYRANWKDLGITGIYLIFPSKENNHWVSVILNATDNTEYCYDEEFMRIIDSIRKIDVQETQPETVALATEPEVTQAAATAETVPETTTASETTAEAKKEKSLFYSTNDLNTAKNGNTGVFAYKNRGGQYENYYIIDFDEGYVYFFTNGNGDTSCERLKIQSGDLNEGVIVTYHDNGSKWSNYLHFKWKRQPDHLVLVDQNLYDWDYYSTDLNEALRIKSGKTIYDY